MPPRVPQSAGRAAAFFAFFSYRGRKTHTYTMPGSSCSVKNDGIGQNTGKQATIFRQKYFIIWVLCNAVCDHSDRKSVV